MAQLKTCADTHPKIIYTSDQNSPCPLCAKQAEIEELIDARTDIDEADIFDLYDELKIVQRRVGRIEKHIGLKPKHWWAKNKTNDTPQASAEPTRTFADF